MEKRKPHCPLSTVFTLIKAGKVRFTNTAVICGEQIGIDRKGILNIVLELTNADFYKSMTTIKDNKIWQDVYRPRTSVGDVYLKITVIEDVLIVSFKEL